MDGDVEKVTLPFDEVGEQDPGSAPATDGALALVPADAPEATAAANAARLVDYAQSWGISIPANFTPATKAQVAYWRELCGAISLTGSEGMQDAAWPADLAPSKPTLQIMADRGLIVRRRRAWHLKRKWHAWLQYLWLTAVPTPALTVADRPALGMPTYAELQVWEAVCRWVDGQPQCHARLPMLDVPSVGEVSSELLLAMRKAHLYAIAATACGHCPRAGRRSCWRYGMASPKRRESDLLLLFLSLPRSPWLLALIRGISIAWILQG
jgi:hypothetical protein